MYYNIKPPPLFYTDEQIYLLHYQIKSIQIVQGCVWNMDMWSDLWTKMKGGVTFEKIINDEVRIIHFDFNPFPFCV